ncbi:MAG: response regulator [Candidatus Kapabacteria bacterium]|jgi:CheY-like chemotaxis protein|nr:response regulator [Candidatus Kapabacteria bacterium]
MSDPSSKTILIADDEPDVRSYMTVLLKDNGYNIILAENGREAFEKAVSEKPDLISLDISMPEESGTKAFKDLQENEVTKDIPVIIVSGVDPRYEAFLSKRKLIKPPSGYFEKPIDREEFLKKVEELTK